MPDAADHDEDALPSGEPTWLAGLAAPCRLAPEADLARMRLAATMFPDDREPLRVGRYVVLHRIGSGGMGVVYAAYDPQLDRKVAIKILHAFDATSQAGLLQEARTLAKLSHPHVVTVHDVGTFELPGDGRPLMFVAMEFVEGRTLSTWLGEQPRTRHEIVDLLIEAGRGLAAAHAMGVVHRDFKPDNVLVDRDGHAHVVDFGLARAHDGALVDASTSFDDTEERAALRTPVYGGTPAYMSPEQVAGTSTDARTDQYSFCVTLWEALYGQRPFAGTSLMELAANIIEGKRRTAARGVRLPRWLRSAIDRGLSIDASTRWPTLEALLHALVRGRARARVVAWSGVAAAVLLATTGVLGSRWLAEQRRVAACETEGATISEVWNDEQRAAVRQGLLATGVHNASTTADKVMPWLDAHASELQEARTQTCLATEVRGEWTPELRDRSDWCLDERELDLEALVHELRAADAQTETSAVGVASSLRAVEPCRDQLLLERMPTPPIDSRVQIDEIRAELARARALEATGAYADALTTARTATQRAEEIGWMPMIAAAHVTVANLHGALGQYADAERYAESAFFDAATAGAFEVAHSASLVLTFVVGYKLGRHAEAERWSKLGDVMRAELPDPARVRESTSLSFLALVLHAKGELAEAAMLHERALELREATYGTEHMVVAMTISNLANVRSDLGEVDAAIELHERVLGIRDRLLGPEHPHVADSLNNLATLLTATGRHERAAAMLERALRIAVKTRGESHPHVGVVLFNLAQVEAKRGDHDEASVLLRRALTIQERAFGRDHPDVAKVLVSLAESRVAAGDADGAALLRARADAILDSSTR